MRQENNRITSDEHLNFWGNFFIDNHLHERGILFETFIEDPRAIALAVIFHPRINMLEDFRPLLPAQRRAIAKPGGRIRAISRVIHENICIGCGCTDSHGCITANGVCHWLRVDTVRGIGVCSECQEMVAAYDDARSTTVQINIQGDTLGNEKFVRETLTPILRAEIHE